jgi:isocitrate lyase
VLDTDTDLLAIARTDSEAATLITSTIDPRDHHYIMGCTNPALQPLSELMHAAEQAGKSGNELQAIEDAWIKQANLKLFHEAVIDTINSGVHVNNQGLIQEFLSASKGKSNVEARAIAKGLTGVDVYFDWEAARTREGYYRYRGGCQCAINRAVAYAPYADLIWMESKLPDYAQAKEFADGVHAVWPEQKYGISPFFPPLTSRVWLTSNPQARLQPLSLLQLESGHASRRAGNLHQAPRCARLLLAVHHACRPASGGAYGRYLLQGLRQAGHAGLWRDHPGAGGKSLIRIPIQPVTE